MPGLLNRPSRWILLALLSAGVSARPQSTVQITVDTAHPQFAIPTDFVGLGFETKSVVRGAYGVSGNFFSPANRQLITLFRNIGIRNIRVGGGTVDGSGGDEHYHRECRNGRFHFGSARRRIIFACRARFGRFCVGDGSRDVAAPILAPALPASTACAVGNCAVRRSVMRRRFEFRRRLVYHPPWYIRCGCYGNLRFTERQSDAYAHGPVSRATLAFAAGELLFQNTQTNESGFGIDMPVDRSPSVAWG